MGLSVDLQSAKSLRFFFTSEDFGSLVVYLATFSARLPVFAPIVAFAADASARSGFSSLHQPWLARAVGAPGSASSGASFAPVLGARGAFLALADIFYLASSFQWLKWGGVL